MRKRIFEHAKTKTRISFVITAKLISAFVFATWIVQHIMLTCPCSEYPLTPHFYIAKLGFTGVYIFFLFLLKTIDCGYSLEPPH